MARLEQFPPIVHPGGRSRRRRWNGWSLAAVIAIALAMVGLIVWRYVLAVADVIALTGHAM